MRGVRRFELVIIGALVLSGPSLVEALTGAVAPTTALVHVALALLLCWAVGAIVERTIDSYARQARQKELAERIDQLRSARGLPPSAAFSLPDSDNGQNPGGGGGVR
jgi:hypothetical protein